MIPATPSPSAVDTPATSGAVQATSQREQRRRGRRAQRKRPQSAEQPRPEDKSALVAWAYVEYQRLRQQGQLPEIRQWCAHFPTCRSALRQVLEFEAFAASCLDRRYPNSNDESIDWPGEGEQRGDFTILRELARGAFARVFLATEASAGGRLVVLKCSMHGDAEARTMGRLTHPHIVPIFSARLDKRSGLTFVCMPYRGSATLEDVLDRLLTAEASPSQASFLLDVIRSRAQPEDLAPPTDPGLLHGSYTDSVIRLAVQLAETLTFLHDNGVCHRDLKPSNVLLDPSGKPLLLDFNLSESEREALVPVGGTLRYMAPEQIRAFLGQCKDGMDKRVDFYALGVMIYELLGGVHPCAALLAEPYQPSQAQAMPEQLKAGFRPFREVCPELERPVAAILDRCLALNASDRPDNAAELAAALKLQFTPARRLRRWIVFHRRGMLAALALLLVAVAALTYVWAITPPYPLREYERGRIAYYAGDFAKAEMHFNQAVHAEPKNARFRHARGFARLQRSKYEKPDATTFDNIAEDLTFTQSGELDVRTLAAHAYTNLRRQRQDSALLEYDILVQKGYRPVMVLNNRACGYLANQRLSEAQDDLDKADKIDPHSQAVHYNRALVAWSKYLAGKVQKIPQQALDDIDQAIQLGPTTSALYRDAAMLYEKAANEDPNHRYHEQALSYLRKAIAAGEPTLSFAATPTLKKALELPEFVALLASRPPRATSMLNLRLIDPLEDLTDD